MKDLTRKGQMEIMGLVIIVILITLGMFFAIGLKANKKPVEAKKTFDQNQLSANYIVSFLRTNTGCRSYTMESMIQDCAVEQKLECNGMESCEFINTTATKLLNATLNRWGKSYKFEITGMKDSGDNILIENDFDEYDDRDSAHQPISLYPFPGNAIVKILMNP